MKRTFVSLFTVLFINILTGFLGIYSRARTCLYDIEIPVC